jgi:colanic acid biosynthesis glycosyl transferase WcaI
MKILIYGLNFAPELTGIGKYSGEMAVWLAAAGNEVRVVTAPPYYPAWAVGAGYSAWHGVQERWQGVRVWRAPLWVPRRPSGAKRLLHLASFAVLSLPALVQQMFWKPDVVVVVAPALMCAPGGLLAARLCGARAWLHIQDFEVDAAFRMGLLKGVLAQNAIGSFERWLLRRFDRVSTISNRMLELLRTKRVDPARTVLFPNWVDVSAIKPMRQTSPYRAELNIADDAVVALYSGSMAGKQGLELLPAAARELQERLPNLVFVLCGDGVFKPTIERNCVGLANVRILPLQPAARLGELLGMADIHLLPQSPLAADLVMPSKLTGMLSSGRPVLATADPGTELATVVTGCGKVVPPNDLPAFVQALVTLAESPELRAQLGAAARHHAESKLAIDRVLVDFEQGLRRCIGEASASRAEPVGKVTESAGLVPSNPGDGKRKDDLRALPK